MYFRTAAFEDGLHRTEDLLKGLNNPLIKLYFLFLKYVLSKINKINLEFQSEAAQLPYMFERINSLHKTILNHLNYKSKLDIKIFATGASVPWDRS